MLPLETPTKISFYFRGTTNIGKFSCFPKEASKHTRRQETGQERREDKGRGIGIGIGNEINSNNTVIGIVSINECLITGRVARFGSVRLRFGDGTVRAGPVFGSGGSSKEGVFVCFSTV